MCENNQNQLRLVLLFSITVEFDSCIDFTDADQQVKVEESKISYCCGLCRLTKKSEET